MHWSCTCPEPAHALQPIAEEKLYIRQMKYLQSQVAPSTTGESLTFSCYVIMTVFGQQYCGATEIQWSSQWPLVKGLNNLDIKTVTST